MAPMKFALGCTILSGWSYPHALFSHVPSPEERAPFFEWARRVGFDGVDLADSWMNWFAMSDDDVRALREQLDEIGLACCALNPYRSITVRHPSAAENRRRLDRTLEVGVLLGVSVVNLALSVPFPAVMTDADRAKRQTELARGDDFTDAEFAEAADHVRALGERAAEHGVALSIELHDDGLTDQSHHVLRIHRAVDLPNVGVNPDLQNGYRVPYPTESWRTALENLAPATNFWHVKSCTRHYVPETGRYLTRPATLREGDIDHRWALTKLVEAGFDGWISVESGHGDALHRAEGDLVYLRELVRDWLPIVQRARPERRRSWGWSG